jgi:N-acyl amino acid synthase of PEP-CTERM/exosortase system
MFDEKFQVFLADTAQGVSVHQRIRYEVFCLDRGFEDPDAFAAPRESDPWDDVSAHFVVRSKETGRWVGATRVVLPNADQGLPVEYLGVLDRQRLPSADVAVGEVSRFCIIRRPPNPLQSGPVVELAGSEGRWGIGSIGKSQQYEVTIGMIRALIAHVASRDIVYCVMLITDSFARLLRKLGVNLHQVGPTLDHRGFRAPYLVNMPETALSMSAKSPSVGRMFDRSAEAYCTLSSLDRCLRANPNTRSDRCVGCLNAGVRPSARGDIEKLAQETRRGVA